MLRTYRGFENARTKKLKSYFLDYQMNEVNNKKTSEGPWVENFITKTKNLIKKRQFPYFFSNYQNYTQRWLTTKMTSQELKKPSDKKTIVKQHKSKYIPWQQVNVETKV